MTRHYSTREDSKRAAYRALLDLPSTPLEGTGFVRLDQNPTAHVAKQVGVADSHARNILRVLKEDGVFEHVRDGNIHFWRVKLPVEDNPQLQLEGASGNSGWDAVVGNLNDILEALDSKVQGMQEEMRQKDERIAELEEQVRQKDQQLAGYRESSSKLQIPENLRNLLSASE